MATITHDTLGWYGFDEAKRGRWARGEDYDHCCHSNLIRALAERGIKEAEMLGGGSCPELVARRPGDFLEFFAEIDLLGALSACPGGDTSIGHSDDTARCHPLRVKVFQAEALGGGWAGGDAGGGGG
eukprot:Skav218056  [mRNA]  locus=scaffold214:1532339:1534755:- [translate_table: standard]